MGKKNEVITALEIVNSSMELEYGVGPMTLSLPAMKELEEALRRLFLAPVISTAFDLERPCLDSIPETWEARRARWRGIMKGLRLKTAGRGYRGAPDNSWWNDTPKSARRT